MASVEGMDGEATASGPACPVRLRMSGLVVESDSIVRGPESGMAVGEAVPEATWLVGA